MPGLTGRLQLAGGNGNPRSNYYKVVFPEVGRPELFHVIRGEPLWRRKKTKLGASQYPPVFSSFNGYAVQVGQLAAAGLTTDEALDKALDDEVELVGIAATESTYMPPNALTNVIENPVICIGGPVDIVNSSDEPIYLGDFIMLRPPKRKDRVNVFKSGGIDRSKKLGMVQKFTGNSLIEIPEFKDLVAGLLAFSSTFEFQSALVALPVTPTAVNLGMSQAEYDAMVPTTEDAKAAFFGKTVQQFQAFAADAATAALATDANILNAVNMQRKHRFIAKQMADLFVSKTVPKRSAGWRDLNEARLAFQDGYNKAQSRVVGMALTYAAPGAQFTIHVKQIDL